MAEAPQFDPSQPFEDVGALSAAPAFDPSRPFEEVKGATAPSHESTAPEWMKTVGSWGEKATSFLPGPAKALTAPIAALPQIYDVGKEMLHSLNPAQDFSEQKAAIKAKGLEYGLTEDQAEVESERQVGKLRRGLVLGPITGAAKYPLAAAAAIPAGGVFRKFASDPLEKAGGPPREVTEGATMVGLGSMGMRPGMNTVRKSFGLPLEGEVLPPSVRSPGGPMTPREGTNARLLPPEYEGTGAAGDPHYDAAWEALGGTRSAGAAGVPGGPLAGYDPKAIAVWRDIVKEQGYNPWEMDRAIDAMSNHGFLGELTEGTREEMRSLHSLGKEGGNIIRQATNQRRDERPERVAGYIRDAFGLRRDPRVEKAQRQKEFEEARPFWDAFEKAPIPPTEALEGLKGRLEASGAWSAASKAMREEGIPLENHFVELPNTGEYVLANPSLPSETTRVPTAKFYQAAKVHIDKLINDAIEHNDRDGARRYIGIKKAMDEAINNHPDPTVRGLWRDALNKSAGPLEWDAAVAKGERVLTENVKYRDFDMLWDTLSDQQKAGYAEGMAQNLEDMLGRKGNADTNTIKHIMGPNNQRKLQRVLEDTKSEHLLSRIKHEETIGAGPLTGPNTANKLTGQKRYQPQDTIAQTFDPSKTPATLYAAGAFGVKKGLAWWQQKSIKEAQQKQDKINADIAHISTLQGAERNAVLRYLAEIPDDIAGSSAPRPSPRPAPARAAGEMEPPPHAQVPEGPPGYPQPEMTVVEATQVLRDFGYPQPTINSMGGTTRVQTADMLQRNYPKGPPSRTPDFPGEVTSRESATAPVRESPIPAEKPLSLLEWIRKQGGISPDDPLANDVKAMYGGKNPAALIRKGGKTLDRLRAGAVSEKYFLDNGDITGGEAETTPNTLLDAMVRERDGDIQYPLGSEVRQTRNKDVEARNQEQKRDLEFSPEARRFDRELSQHGVTRDMVPNDVRYRALDIMRVEGEGDPVVAYERALEEKYGHGGERDETGAESWEGLIFPQERERVAPAGNGNAPQRKAGDGQAVRADGNADREKEPPLKRATGGRVDPSAINSNPTEAQKEAGNYAKDHVHIHGLDITIENAKGSKRSGIDKGGKPWSVALPAHYGYIKGSVGADKDHVDVYLGPHLKSRHVFVVDQKDAETDKFDEHKAFLGFASAKQARNCYLKAFSDGKGKARLGAMHEADIDGFKAWLAAGDTTKPIGKKAA